MHFCRRSNRALIILAGLGIVSFTNNHYLLLPLITPQDQLIGGHLFLGWYLII
jgi:hypothetical protein